MFRMEVHFDRRGDADLPGGFQNEGAHSKDGLMFSLGIDCIGSLITESSLRDYSHRTVQGTGWGLLHMVQPQTPAAWYHQNQMSLWWTRMPHMLHLQPGSTEDLFSHHSPKKWTPKISVTKSVSNHMWNTITNVPSAVKTTLNND